MWMSIRSLAPRALAALELAAVLALVHWDVQQQAAGPGRERELCDPQRSDKRVSVQPRLVRLRSPDGLSPREVEVLHLLAAGQTNREIAAALVVSVRTVDHHLAKIYRKTGSRGRVDAATLALRGAPNGSTPEPAASPFFQRPVAI